jgi:enterochelin esterase-like enzyme
MIKRRLALRFLLGLGMLLATSLARAGMPPLPADLQATPLAERVLHYTFTSGVLKKSMAFTVVLPKDYEATGPRWPVLFFFHGLGRNEKTLIEDPASLALLLDQPYVIVLPKGDNGWYFDSPFDPTHRYASYLDEVLCLAERVVSISGARAQRAIGGWSAGGFGSVWTCIRHPQSFSVLGTIIAVVDYPAPGTRFPISETIFGSDPSRWPKFNPLNRAAELKHLNILLVIGEQASDAAMNDRLAAALQAAGNPAATLRLPGGHTFPTVQQGLGPVLEFARQHLVLRVAVPARSALRQ